MPAVLNITDGTTTISLVKPPGANGFHLNAWQPAVAQYKEGGTWQSSPLSDGRRLVDRRFNNVIETFELKLRGASQDEAIQEMQNLRRLLEKAASYWTTDWQNEPVWIEAQASCETNPRYALIYTGAIPQDDQPFAQPFLQPHGAAMDELTLVVERGPWTAQISGGRQCVKISETDWAYRGLTVNTTDPYTDVKDIIRLSSLQARMLAADLSTPPLGSQPIIWITDDGSSWREATTNPPNYHAPVVLAENTQSGAVLLATTIGLCRSTDGGVTWSLITTDHYADPSAYFSLAQRNGRLYFCCLAHYSIERSLDNGSTWTSLYSVPQIPRIITPCQDGTLVAIAGDSYVYRSDDETNWSLICTLPFDVYLMVELNGKLYATSGADLYVSEDEGFSFRLISTLPSSAGSFRDLILGADGYFYAATSEVRALWRSRDGYDWQSLGVAGSGFWTACAYDDKIYCGAYGEIYVSEREILVGQEETCSDSVFLSNKENRAQLTNIWIYDASTSGWESRFPSSSFPFYLFPNPPGVGDIIYFGSRTDRDDTGPFSSLIFDLQPITASSLSTVWEYYNGTSWTTLSVKDETDSFRTLGVGGVFWIPPTNWSATTVNGVTGYWVRVRVSAISDSASAPQQRERNIYTVISSHVHVDQDEVGGDLPARMQLRLHNRSDADGPGGSIPNAWSTRMIVGLRSRGDAFPCYFNLADEQNPPGISVSVGSDVAFVDRYSAPSGRCARYTTATLNEWADRVTITLSPSVARDCYGVFHAFLRAYQSNRNATMGEVKVRLQVRLGSLTLTTAEKSFPNLNDWQLIDFGQIALPSASTLSQFDLGETTLLSIQGWAGVSGLVVYLYDLILIPTDEWSGDFVDRGLSQDSTVQNGCLLDIDSLGFPKVEIRALSRSHLSDFVRAVYEPIVNGPAVLQPNSNQRLYFLSARGIVTGAHTGSNNASTLTDSYASFLTSGVRPGMTVYNTTDGSSAVITAVTATTVSGTLRGGIENDWDKGDAYYILCPNWVSEPWVVHSVQLWANPRYLSARGDR